jgi:hypothetical protein
MLCQPRLWRCRCWWRNSAKLIKGAFPISHLDRLGVPSLAADLNSTNRPVRTRLPGGVGARQRCAATALRQAFASMGLRSVMGPLLEVEAVDALGLARPSCDEMRAPFGSSFGPIGNPRSRLEQGYLGSNYALFAHFRADPAQGKCAR